MIWLLIPVAIVYLVVAWFVWNLFWIDVGYDHKFPPIELLKWSVVTALWPVVLVLWVIYMVIGSMVLK